MCVCPKALTFGSAFIAFEYSRIPIFLGSIYDDRNTCLETKKFRKEKGNFQEWPGLVSFRQGNVELRDELAGQRIGTACHRVDGEPPLYIILRGTTYKYTLS